MTRVAQIAPGNALILTVFVAISRLAVDAKPRNYFWRNNPFLSIFSAGYKHRRFPRKTYILIFSRVFTKKRRFAFSRKYKNTRAADFLDFCKIVLTSATRNVTEYSALEWQKSHKHRFWNSNVTFRRRVWLQRNQQKHEPAARAATVTLPAYVR